MMAADREQQILEHLKGVQSASTAELVALTGTSLATVRRDLNALHSRGLLHKVHGGARMRAVSPTGACEDDPAYVQKDRIARAAADLVNSGEVLFLGAGYTCTLVARHIRHKEDITVVTTNVNAVLELAGSPRISMLLLGGAIHVGSRHIETLDEYTLQLLEKYYFTQSFITVDGIDLTAGYTIHNRLQIPLYLHLLQKTGQFCLLADHAKFGRRAFARFCDMQAIPQLITNRGVESTYLEYYQEQQIPFTLV